MFSTTSTRLLVSKKLMSSSQTASAGLFLTRRHSFTATATSSFAFVVIPQQYSFVRFCSSSSSAPTPPPPPKKNENETTQPKKEDENTEKKIVEETPTSAKTQEAATVADVSNNNNVNTKKEDSSTTATPTSAASEKLAGSTKTDEAAQIQHSKEEDKNKIPPKGFELFYLPPFSKPPPETENTNPKVGSAEAAQIYASDKHHNQALISKRLTQLAFFFMSGYIFSKFWYRNSGAHQLGGETFYYYDRVAAEHEAKKNGAASTILAEAKDEDTAAENGDEKHDKDGGKAAADAPKLLYFPEANVRVITVDPARHSAVYFSEDGHRLFTQRFIDFGNWLRDVEKRANPESGPFVRMEVAIGFPFVAIAFLWLMPVLGRFYRSVNFGLGHARQEAKRAIQKQQSIQELETPSKGRFRFKKEQDIKTRLNDVAGLTEAKHEVVEIIDFMKNPEKYQKLGAKLPKGVLCDGPPGVGKTLLARAIAGEAGLNFVSCSGSEFDEVYVGVGAMRVRELFKAARENAPCVVFIDEIDTFGKKRRRDAKGTSRGTINALLSELDGFKESSRIMVLAATNRADILDDALTRSGRFDRKISVDLPPHKDRVAIALVHIKPLRLNPALDKDKVAESIASLTPGCSGADIYNICNEAAIVASRLEKDYVDMECFHKAMDRIMIGLERKARKFEKHEKERLAIHEAGHVVLTWFLKTTDPIMKATIAPRGGQVEGTSRKLPHERFISTQEALHEKMISKLGGYVAEEFFFSNISSNAAQDLANVTEQAKSEICVYGMAPQNVGHFGYPMNQEDAITKPFSEAKSNIIDKEISSLVTKISDQAREMLKKYQTEVRMVAGVLMKQETVTAKELWIMLGERPEMSPEFRKYLESEQS